MAITIGTGSISFDGETFLKADLTDLKAGKSISTSGTKQMANKLDNTTYVRMSVPGKAYHYASDVALIQLDTASFGLGDTNVPMTLEAKSLIITGSTVVSGSFTVTDLLTVLANYGQTGSFSVSGSTTLDGDVNADGAVTVTDLLTVLGGFGASGSCEISGSLTISGSNAAGSPPALMVTGSTELSGSVVVNGSFGVGNLLDLLANWGAVGVPTGSGEGGGVSVGDINLDGQVNVQDLLLLLIGLGNPNCISQDLLIPQNINYQMVGPEICVSQSIYVTVGTNSYFSIT